MTDTKNDPTTGMQKVARQIQQALSQYGDAVAMGTAPTIVVFQANENKSDPDEVRMWHAAIVYRQHVAPTPERALASLGTTIFEAAAKIEEMTATDTGTVAPVKEIAGGHTLLPDVKD